MKKNVVRQRSAFLLCRPCCQQWGILGWWRSTAPGLPVPATCLKCSPTSRITLVISNEFISSPYPLFFTRVYHIVQVRHNYRKLCMGLTPTDRATHCVTPRCHRAAHKAGCWVWSTGNGRRSTVDNTWRRSTCHREIILRSEVGEKLQRELRLCLEIFEFPIYTK